MPPTKNKVSGVIDVSVTRNHHDYYGKEEDPRLDLLLDRAKERTGDTDNKSVGSDETVDITTTALVIPNTARRTWAYPPVIAPKNVQIIDEGENAENDERSCEISGENKTENVNPNTAATPRSIDVRYNREISSSMSVSVRDPGTTQVCQTNQRLQPSQSSRTSPVRSAAASLQTAGSVDISVENVGYERLENETITSIPK